MPGRSVALDVIVRAQTQDAVKGIDDAGSKFGKFQDTMGKMVAPALAVVGAIGVVGKAAIDSASRTEQAMGALDSVFGSNAEVVKGWARDAAQTVGLAQSQYGELASTLGAQLNNMGLSGQQAMSGTQDLITLGADLAATFGGDTTQAVEALGSALRGEADPAERYGLKLNQATVNAKLAEKGLSGLTGEALTAAKTQAILELATEQAGGAVGQFAREADSAAGSAQKNAAAWENAKSALGEALLPVVSAVTEKFSELATWISENSTLVMVLVGVVGGLAAAILLINAGLAIYQAVTIAAAAAQWLFNLALFAFPLTWIVIAIIAVIAAIVLLWNKCEGFRNLVTAVWNAIKTAFSTSIDAIKSFLQSLGDFFGKIPGWLSSALSTVNNIITWPFRTAIDVVKSYVQWFSSMFAPVVGWISSALSGIYNAITTPFRTAIDWVKDAIGGIKSTWNSVARSINGVSVQIGPVPDWVPGIGGQSWTFDPPNLPTLASGGWVTRPTLALVGEGRGAEIVAPETMLRRLLREENGGRNYAINVSVAAGVAPAEVGRQIVDQIRAFERAAGPGWRTA